MKNLIFFLLLNFLAIDALFAQQGVRGCVVGNVIYTQPSGRGNDYFLRSPGNRTSTCGFQRVGNTSNCRLYNSGDINTESSYTLYPDAASSGWVDVSNCPVDDTAWILFVPISFFSMYSLSKKQSLCEKT